MMVLPKMLALEESIINLFEAHRCDGPKLPEFVYSLFGRET